MANYLGSSLHTRTSLYLKGNVTYLERLRMFMICEANQGLRAIQSRNHHINLGSHQLEMETGLCRQEATSPSTLMALLTIMMASCRDRSVSSMNCSAPPRRMMVQVFALGQPVKKLYLYPGPKHTCELSAANLLCSDLTKPSQHSAATFLFLTKVPQSHI